MKGGGRGWQRKTSLRDRLCRFRKLYKEAMEQAILANYTLPVKPSSDGYFHCQIADSTKKSGRRQIKAKTLASLKVKILEHERGIYGQQRKTFRECFEIVQAEKLIYVKNKEKRLSVQNTITVTHSAYHRYFSGTSFEQMFVDEITKKDIENICFNTLQRLDMSKKAFLSMRSIIKAVMRLAYEEYWIQDNPYQRVNFHKYDDMLIAPTPVSERVHSDSEIARMLDYIHDYQQQKPAYIVPYCLELIILAGLRRGEAAPLEISDIHENYIAITKEQLTVKKNNENPHDYCIVVSHTKTYVDRKFPITKDIRSFLDRYLKIHREYYQENPYLFPEPKNATGIISNKAVYKFYERLCKNLGIEISRSCIRGPHSFRRNGITRVTNNTGGDLILASQIYGNSPQTAKQFYYTGLDLEKAKAALED